MDIKNFIAKRVKLRLFENIQLADKLYFNNNKLSQEDKDIILNITHGDNYTKIVTDFYFSVVRL